MMFGDEGHDWESVLNDEEQDGDSCPRHDWETVSDSPPPLGEAASLDAAYNGDVDDAESAFGLGSDVDADEFEDARERTPGEEFVSYMSMLLLTRAVNARQFCTSLY